MSRNHICCVAGQVMTLQWTSSWSWFGNEVATGDTVTSDIVGCHHIHFPTTFRWVLVLR